jgi:hypothetical protein
MVRSGATIPTLSSCQSAKLAHGVIRFDDRAVYSNAANTIDTIAKHAKCVMNHASSPNPSAITAASCAASRPSESLG